MMLVIIDADSCKVSARDILLRRAQKGDIELLFIANNSNKLPADRARVRSMLTDSTPEAADNAIVDITEQRDRPCLVVTADIVLADRLIKKDVHVMNDYGTFFNEDNIGERLSERNFSLAMREAGLWETKKKQSSPSAFANALDRFLSTKR